MAKRLAIAFVVFLILEACTVAAFGGWRGFVVYADGHSDIAVFASLDGLLACLAAALSRRSIVISVAWFVGTLAALVAVGKIIIATSALGTPDKAVAFGRIADICTGLLLCFLAYRTGAPQPLQK